MARPIPQKDPNAVAELVRMAREARGRLAEDVRRIEELVRRVDPMELLSQLTVLFQTHNAGEQPDRDQSARWQVHIEWLAWLVFSHRLTALARPELIDDPYLHAVDNLLEEYFRDVTMTLPEPVEGLSDDQNELRSLIQLEAIHVRGEGFLTQFESMAIELYSPHDQWCVANLGLTIADALVVVRSVPQLFEEQLQSMGQAQNRIKDEVLAEPSRALTLDLPAAFRNPLIESGIPTTDVAEFAETVARIWFFSRAAEIVGFTAEELRNKLKGRIPPDRVDSFLDLMTRESNDIHGEPDPLSLTPLAVTPLVRHGGRYFMFVPPLLIQGLVHAFHTKLFQNEAYRPSYDETRAGWLERSAVEAFRKMLPNAETGWSLVYGPKKQRLELDGLIRYDNKLILIECKWKSPTLLTLGGDVVAALKDVDQAILQPLAQAKRARDWIQERESAEFVEKTSGRRIVVRRDDIAEVFLATLVGSGAWSLIAANLVRLTPLGLFGDGEFPWALSLNDLRVVAECLEFPSQLFDFLRRRFEAQRNPRFRFHDEWDLLGVYLAGVLDIDDPRFEDMDFVALDGFDREIQDYYYSLSNPSVTAEKPRRPLPSNIRDLLVAVERAHSPEKTDAICVILSWPDWGLEELGKTLEQARKKAIWDGRAHAVAVRHPWRASGVAFACGFRKRQAIREVLWTACQSQREKMAADEFVGFGIDLGAPWDPITLYYNSARERRTQMREDAP